MIVGVPQEVKNNEFRVGLTPGNVSWLCKQGHSVLIQRGAGAQIGLSDEAYRLAGAGLIAPLRLIQSQASTATVGDKQNNIFQFKDCKDANKAQRTQDTDDHSE